MLAQGTMLVTRGTEQAFTQAALPMDAKTSFIKGQDTEARCVRPAVIHPYVTMKAATPHSRRSLQFVSGMHARATPYVRGQEWDADVETPHQNRGGTTGKGQQGHTQQQAPN